MEYLEDESGLLVKKVKPNFKKLGATYKARLKDVAALITALNQEEIRALEQTGKLEKQLDGEPLVLTPEDVEISSEDIPGWIVATEDGLTVALDITISDELKREGIARDETSHLIASNKVEGTAVYGRDGNRCVPVARDKVDLSIVWKLNHGARTRRRH